MTKPSYSDNSFSECFVLNKRENAVLAFIAKVTLVIQNLQNTFPDTFKCSKFRSVSHRFYCPLGQNQKFYEFHKFC